MSRWRMHKLGFINFWLYDLEEFLLEDGHILLRGANASGKSITTQSFIPFLLDGNRSPERLDPFGSRDRKMDFYLLGDGEREEATGYLYLEFRKDEAADYLTIGIGMRAQRGKGVTDFWGFCLHDGRRIGMDDVLLYETIGRQLVPRSKLKLKNLLDDADNWAENPGVYKQLVNDRVFQFRDIRQYAQLIALLIKVRAPKLSKEAFRPSEVKRILNDSLQVLTDEDLSAMVSTMDQMDTLEDTLRDYRVAMRDAKAIRIEYTRYNQFMLGMKGKAYWEAVGQKERLQQHCKDGQERSKQQTVDLEQQTQSAEEADAFLARAKAQRAAMGEDPLSAKQRQLEEALGRASSLAENAAVERTRLQQLQDLISKNEVKLHGYTSKRDNARLLVQRGAERLRKLEMELGLGEDYAHYDTLFQGECATDKDCQAIQTTLLRQKKQIQESLRCLRAVDEARKHYDSACQALDRADAAVAEARTELRDAQQQEQEERDLLIEAMVRRQSLNQELCFSEGEFLALRQAVTRYRSAADWNSVQQLVEGCHSRQQSERMKEDLAAGVSLKEAESQTEKLRQDLLRLRRQSDPIPARNSQRETARIMLTMHEIPHAAFYEAVDFDPKLSQAERDLLEAQLMDAGLLDALLLAAPQQKQMMDLLEQYPDCFLRPGTAVEDPITKLVPDESCPLSGVALQCLQGISCSDLNAHSALLPTGWFRNGILHGCSLAERSAGFVGASARRANLERQISALEEGLQSAEERQQRCQERVLAAQQRLALLQEERKQMPNASDLGHALDLLAQAQTKAETADAEKSERAGAEQSNKRRLEELEQESRTLSAGLPYPRTTQAFLEAEELAEECHESLRSLRGNCELLRSAIAMAEQMAEHIAEQRDDVDQKQNSIRFFQQNLHTEEGTIQILQEFLQRPEHQARAQRLQELIGEIEIQDKRSRAAMERCAALRVELQTSARDMERDQSLLQDAILKELDVERYFSEDLALGFFSEEGESSLPHYARQAHSKIRATDREGTAETLGASLSKHYQEHNNSLLKYMPQIETIFDAPSQLGLLRQRLLITLQREGKALSLDEFILFLQEQIDMAETVLLEKDRELFENILNETISHKLRARIEESQEWGRDMSALMKRLITSMGLNFSLEWRPKKAETSEELDTAQLVLLLNKDRALLTAEDSQRTSRHFRTKIKTARQTAKQREWDVSYADLIREVLDYRTWYEFSIYYQREGEAKKELTDRTFNKFSGGEKAMAIYLPQFAAVSSQYKKAGAGCPLLLALDEAFAGVDDKNIAAMFELVHSLDFDYIMNSQALWGCYPCVHSLDIVEFYRPNNAQVVTLLRYRWNGLNKTRLEE